MKNDLSDILGEWTPKDLEELYVEKNYSMDLVSRITHIPLAVLSRILWQYGMPDKKRERYGINFTGEIQRLSDADSRRWQNDFLKETKKQDDVADDFFSGL